MEFDLCLKQIDSVYYVNTEKWERAYYAPRMKDGLALMLDGVNKYTFPSGDQIAQKSDILVLPGNVPYSGTSLSNGMFEGIVVDFDCFDGSSLCELNLSHVITVTDKKYYETLFREIVRVWENKYTDKNLHIKSLVYQLVHKLFKEVNGTSNDKISEVLEYINANLADKSLTVAGLSRKFFISESTLMRGIQKLTGCTTNEYINLQRLEKAREYIMVGEKSIKEIALLCGFSSPYYFSNVYKKKYGYSPKIYRNMLNENNGGNKFN